MSSDDELLKKALGATPECPDFAEFAEAVRRGDEGALTHRNTCPHCSSEWKLYESFASGVVVPEEAEKVRWVERHIVSPVPKAGGLGARIRSWWSLPMLIPAAAAAAAVLLVIGMRVPDGTLGIDGSTSENSVERSQSIDLIGPKGDIPSAPELLRWSSVPGALSYRVRIQEVDKTTLWESVAPSPGIAVPLAVQQKALPGKRLLWVVEALDASGRILASGTQDFRRQLRH